MNNNNNNIVYLFFLFNVFVSLASSQCPPDFIMAPCSCSLGTRPRTDGAVTIHLSDLNVTEHLSITCANIHDSSFDLRALFAKLSSLANSTNHSNFHIFLLQNTTVRSLPENVFVNITFENLLFENNLQLTTIDRNAFSNSPTTIQAFQTLNSNLSDSESIFSMLRQLPNLRFLSLQNDQLKFIPGNAFNHTYLGFIFFGLEYRNQSQPIERIGDYAFDNLPNLHFLRIISPKLSRITKYALAQRKRSIFTTNQPTNMLEFYIGGRMIDSNSFALTSLTRFGNRYIFLRFFNTSITYLDENVFQPFLEANPWSLLGINEWNPLFGCDCRSAWVQKDYRSTTEQTYPRVYPHGECWQSDFTKNC